MVILPNIIRSKYLALMISLGVGFRAGLAETETMG